ncbi:MAG TPA: DHHA1 domain-containing protein [Treponemataceae bacterium]|nr:DHHA1 domain-containing protein [Treponemataceae bacterium]
MENPFAALVGSLERARPVIVQAHDFPDHDAMGSAYGLSELLLRRGFDASITYGGEIQSISLSAMIERLGIPILPFAEAERLEGGQSIIVDGSPVGGTVKTVAGALMGVIDHHPVRTEFSCPFVDVRPDVGSCSTIIWTYWKESGEIPDQTTATALLAGIQLDTDFLSRRVSRTDLDAHYALFFLGDIELAREVVQTSLGTDQLAEVGRALATCRRSGSILVAELRGDYSGELLSVMADFLLRLREITFAIVLATGPSGTRLSARTRDRRVDAGAILRKVLAGWGSGGGHPHMAGGFIEPSRRPDTARLLADIEAEISKA